jgi:hypothetical protein
MSGYSVPSPEGMRGRKAMRTFWYKRKRVAASSISAPLSQIFRIPLGVAQALNGGEVKRVIPLKRGNKEGNES